MAGIYHNFPIKAYRSKFAENRLFELTMMAPDKDWNETKVGFELRDKNGTTDVEFYHTGWPLSDFQLLLGHVSSDIKAIRGALRKTNGSIKATCCNNSRANPSYNEYETYQ